MMLSPSNLSTPQEITFRHSSNGERIRNVSASPIGTSTKSIRIQARSTRTAPGSNSELSHIHSNHSPSPSTKHLYDHATWRMYYRIMNARKQRVDELNRIERERTTNGTDVKNNHRLESSQMTYEANALRPNTRSRRASSICSVEGTLSCDRSEDEIFSLDL